MKKEPFKKPDFKLRFLGPVLISLEKVLTFPLWLVRWLHGGWSSVYRAILSWEFVQKYRDIKKLIILSEIIHVFQQHGIPYWVSGGFAYDSLEGKLGRHHCDIDLVVSQKDIGQVMELLKVKGYSFKEIIPSFCFARRHGEKIDFFCFELEGDTVVSKGLNAEIRYPRSFLDRAVEASLCGVSFKTFPADVLMFFAQLRPRPNQEILSRFPVLQKIEIRKIPAKVQIIEAVVRAV